MGWKKRVGRVSTVAVLDESGRVPQYQSFFTGEGRGKEKVILLHTPLFIQI